MPELLDPVAASSVRRKLPFGVPAELLQPEHVASGPLRSYDALVAKREAHLDASDRSMLAARDALVKVLGPGHQAVTQMNDRISNLNALWMS